MTVIHADCQAPIRLHLVARAARDETPRLADFSRDAARLRGAILCACC
jgi:hypothetical protein